MKKITTIFAACAMMLTFCSVVHAYPMAHWANFREYNGNLIDALPAGTEVTVIDSSGAWSSVYVPSYGMYGMIATVYIWGGTDWEYENPLSYGGGYSTYSYDGNYEYTYEEKTEDYTEYNNYQTENYSTQTYSAAGAWVDVDISDQICRLYVDNDIIAWDYCVTGNAVESPTPIGEWSVYYKESPTVLCGTSPSGKAYETPVDYWMPFCGGCGLHDASWRSEFGGTIYQWGGSYGCVNLPHWLAEKIYGYVDSGTVVNVHE